MAENQAAKAKVGRVRVLDVMCPSCEGHPASDDLEWFRDEWEIDLDATTIRDYAFYCLCPCHDGEVDYYDVGPTPIAKALPHMEPYRLLIATEAIDG